jgi:hypothetical protein
MKHIWIRDKDGKLEHAEPQEIDILHVFATLVVCMVSGIFTVMLAVELLEYFDVGGL